MMPDSHVSHFSGHLNLRYSTSLKFVGTCLKKQEALQVGHRTYLDALHRMESWLESSNKQLAVHEKDVTSRLGYQSSYLMNFAKFELN